MASIVYKYLKESKRSKTIEKTSRNNRYVFKT